jgi:hypothetical protein
MTNSIFKQNYDRYLEQIGNLDLAERQWNLGITVNQGVSVVPFFNKQYQVSKLGISGDLSYAAKVVLLKYLLMCPKEMPVGGTDWIPYREFKDSGQSNGSGLSDYVTQTLAERFTGKLVHLQDACYRLGGAPPKTKYPHDLAFEFQALPRVPVLFLFNDAEEGFPAHLTILYQRRAENFLDAECRVMLDGYLLEELK